MSHVTALGDELVDRPRDARYDPISDATGDDDLRGWPELPRFEDGRSTK
jgi:hypothetical protein